jgi:hypothetical protein
VATRTTQNWVLIGVSLLLNPLTVHSLSADPAPPLPQPPTAAALAQDAPAPRRTSQPRGNGVDLREAPAVFRQPTAPDAPNAVGSDAWTITLSTFRGPDALAVAEGVLPKVRELPAVRDAVVQRRGEAVLITVGRFSDPAGDDAQRRLKEIRALVVDGEAAFPQAILTPPTGGQLGSRPEYNLLRARDQMGKAYRLTLQIGVYGRDDLERPTEADLAEARKQAEQAAANLRREGELAFYYHGPRRSMVTVGLFTEDDLGSAAKNLPVSPLLQQLRKKFPHNLYNGQGIRERTAGQTEARIQPSQTVRIPER